ncbi:hypothetical protein [Methylobacterium sp. JK268]
MRTTAMALAGALVVGLGGAALAQAPAPGGSTERNMNNPASVKSNAEKGMPGRDTPVAGTAPTAGPAATGTVTSPATGTVPKPTDPTPNR